MQKETEYRTNHSKVIVRFSKFSITHTILKPLFLCVKGQDYNLARTEHVFFNATYLYTIFVLWPDF